MAGNIRIGISGWRYAPWRGSFYPDGLVQANELAYASRTFPVIELNGSFYALQTPERYARWAADTPRGFEFTVKAPRYITHIRRLEDAQLPVEKFIASGLAELGPKLGPVLWQLPPSFVFDAGQLEDFLKLLPHTAGRHRLRHAMEVRHESFVDPVFIALLRHYQVALVVADTGGRWPEYHDLTADFVYVRLHGANAMYTTGYSARQLDTWAGRIKAWAEGGQPKGAKLISSVTPAALASRDVYCFFDNTMKTEAPNNVRQLMAKATPGLALDNTVTPT